VNVLKSLGVLTLLVAGAVAWERFGTQGDDVGHAGVQATAGSRAGGPDTGFVDMPMPDGMPARGVVVFAPENCPQDAGQRANALASHLEAQGIPFTRSSNAEYSALSSQDEVSRVMSVMNGPLPIVYVNGRARANPLPRDVVAEYHRGRG
jgi:hypothetical protein